MKALIIIVAIAMLSICGVELWFAGKFIYKKINPQSTISKADSVRLRNRILNSAD